jgi:ArsR family transcriptional regulator, arsenate/arsenite/antimonite-responsive transcriptional repressor
MHQSSSSLKNVRKYLATIAQPMRLDILLMLQQGELCVCDIYKKLGIAQNLASHHLKVLVDFNLLTSRKEGLKVLYTRNEAIIASYQTLLDSTLCAHPACECKNSTAQHTIVKNECCKVTTGNRAKKITTKN